MCNAIVENPVGVVEMLIVPLSQYLNVFISGYPELGIVCSGSVDDILPERFG